MKIDLKVLFSMLFGALIVFLIMSNQNDLQLVRAVNASEIKAEMLGSDELKRCEVFFKDDRDAFEEEINSRLKGVRLLQSNVLWSETTKQFGFYALICY